MRKKKIALVKGDGAASEMMDVACWIAIEAAKKDGVEIEFIETPMGWNAYEKHGDTLPKESLKKATEIGTLFFGGVGDPKYDNTIGKKKPEMKPEARCLLAIRKEWNLLLNFRPMIYYKSLAHLCGVRSERIPSEGIKQIWLRFLLEDSYFGNADFLKNCMPGTHSWAVAQQWGVKPKAEVSENDCMISDIAYYKQETIEKYLRVAFNYARENNLPLISIDKANVMARYDYWRKIATRIGKEEFPDVPLTHQLVDSANALLFDPAKLHGVIACGNEHGDILSDGAAAALGSMGMMCSSAINPDNNMAMFESGAGTAPMLAGQDKANPIGRILTASMMLWHIGAVNGSIAIDEAVKDLLMEGYRTPDLAVNGDMMIVGTRKMGELIELCL